MSRRPSPFTVRLAAIAAAGLAVRVAYTLLIAKDTSGIGDFFFYHGQANLLAEGKGFIHPLFYLDGLTAPSAEHPPLWPLVLSVTSLLGGTGFEAHRLTGCVLGALAIVVVGLLGRRAGGERVGLIAAGIAAVYPTLVAADGSLMSETLYGLLVGVALLVALRLREHPRVLLAAALGALIGLAALTRAEGLLFLVFLALPVCVAARRVNSTRTAVVAFVAACVAAAVVIAPWTIRNWSAFDQPVLISVNDSTVLAGANCDQSYSGPDTGFWILGCLAPRKPGGNEAKQAEIWRRQGTDYLGDHVGELPRVAVIRVLRTWDLWQPRRQVGFAEGRDRTVQEIGTGVYLLMLPVALLGAFLLRRRRFLLYVLLTPAIAATVSTIAGYGLPRFRHAAELALVVLVAVAVDWAAAALREGRFSLRSGRSTR
jgi:4-amino-4-deoxy-L-arabinose transferase-like glycosyltransferase